MRKALLILVAALIISAAAISAVFLIPELREIILPKNPMSVEEECKALSQKALDAPPYKADYEYKYLYSEDFAKKINSKTNYYLDLRYIHFSRTLNKSIAKYDEEYATLHDVNSRFILCQRTYDYSPKINVINSEFFIIKTRGHEVECSLLNSQIPITPTQLAHRIADKNGRDDYKISLAGEKKIANRSARCYKISCLGNDLNDLIGLAMPAEKLLLNAELCFEKELGAIALIDYNIFAEQAAYEKNSQKRLPLVSAKVELIKVELENFSEEGTKIVKPFSTDANYTEEGIFIKLTAFEDLEGTAKVIVTSYYSSGQHINLEKKLGEIKLRSFESKDFKVLHDGLTPNYYPQITFCIDDVCEKSKTYYSQIPGQSFGIRYASCDKNRIYIKIDALKDLNSNLKVKLKSCTSGETLLEEDRGHIAMAEDESMEFSFEPQQELPKRMVIEVCIADECYENLSAFIFSPRTDDKAETDFLSFCSRCYPYSSHDLPLYAYAKSCDSNSLIFKMYKNPDTNLGGNIIVKIYSDFDRKNLIFDKNMGHIDFNLNKFDGKEVALPFRDSYAMQGVNPIYFDVCLDGFCYESTCYKWSGE